MTRWEQLLAKAYAETGTRRRRPEPPKAKPILPKGAKQTERWWTEAPSSVVSSTFTSATPILPLGTYSSSTTGLYTGTYTSTGTAPRLLPVPSTVKEGATLTTLDVIDKSGSAFMGGSYTTIPITPPITVTAGTKLAVSPAVGGGIEFGVYDVDGKRLWTSSVACTPEATSVMVGGVKGEF